MHTRMPGDSESGPKLDVNKMSLNVITLAERLEHIISESNPKELRDVNKNLRPKFIQSIIKNLNMLLFFRTFLGKDILLVGEDLVEVQALFEEILSEAFLLRSSGKKRSEVKLSLKSKFTAILSKLNLVVDDIDGSYDSFLEGLRYIFEVANLVTRIYSPLPEVTDEIRDEVKDEFGVSYGDSGYEDFNDSFEFINQDDNVLVEDIPQLVSLRSLMAKKSAETSGNALENLIGIGIIQGLTEAGLFEF